MLRSMLIFHKKECMSASVLTTYSLIIMYLVLRPQYPSHLLRLLSVFQSGTPTVEAFEIDEAFVAAFGK